MKKLNKVATELRLAAMLLHFRGLERENLYKLNRKAPGGL